MTLASPDPVDRLSDEQVEALIDSWAPANRAQLSEHTRLEILHATEAGHEPGDPPPLNPDDPVPGCSCTRCLALARGVYLEDAEIAVEVVRDLAREDPSERLEAATEARKAWRALGFLLPPARWLCRRAREIPGAVEPEPDPANRDRDELPVEEARRTSILDVATRLGLGEPMRRGREHVVRCPLHVDHDPSLRLNPDEGPPGGVWKCWPCDRGGDAIDLVRAVRGCGFPEAVRWIAGDGRAA